MIENRNLKPGTVLIKRYKRRDYRCEVVKGEGGKLAFRVGRKEYPSPSAAGSAVMGGVACNGWTWWTVEGAEKLKTSKKPNAATNAIPSARKVKRAPKAGRRVTKPKGPARTAKGEEPSERVEKPVHCGECGQEFKTGREAAAHMRQTHSAPEATGAAAR